MSYSIQRPPLAKTLELPKQKDLLKLKPGDLVKLIFEVSHDSPERMWVLLKDTSDMDEWTGVIDNDPFQKQMAKTLPAGTKVKFHPLDIIQTHRM